MQIKAEKVSLTGAEGSEISADSFIDHKRALRYKICSALNETGKPSIHTGYFNQGGGGNIIFDQSVSNG